MLYPINTETRTVISLDGIWRFCLAPADEIPDAGKPLDTEEVMAVPGSWNDQTASRAIRDHVGEVLYEREFTVPRTLLDERLVLRFGSVTHSARIYLNGIEIASHKGGFTPFETEIGDQIRPGKNRLTVQVSNILDYTTLPVGVHTDVYDEKLKKRIRRNTPNFDFFNYGGIHRPVKLYSTPPSYIQDLLFSCNINGGTAVIRPKIQSIGDFSHFTVTLLDEDGRLVRTSRNEEEFSLSNFRPWQPGNAYLYTMRVEGWQGEELLDVYEQELGLRTVEVRSGSFLINGRPFYFKGFGRHEDTAISGRGLNEAANVLDFSLMRWIGANSFRTSHYPYSEEMMRLAERQGIVVIDEIPAVGLYHGFGAMFTEAAAGEGQTFELMETREAHEQAIRELIDRDRHLACVVLWSVANEPASQEPGAFDYFEPLIALTREYDPQHRPVTMALIQNSLPADTPVVSLIDVIDLNRYYGWYTFHGELDEAGSGLRDELREWIRRWPGKPILMTEYGADTMAGFHSLTSEPFTEEYQVDFYRVNNEVLDEFPEVIGEHVWNFADFATAPSVLRVYGNKKGVFTRDRQPKMAAYYFQERWSRIPDFNYKQKTPPDGGPGVLERFRDRFRRKG